VLATGLISIEKLVWTWSCDLSQSHMIQ